MRESTYTVKLAVKSGEIASGLKEIIASVPGFRVLPYVPDPAEPEAYACDLLIMEVGDEMKKEFRLVQQIQNSQAASEIFLTSSRTESEILLGALRAGAREFLPHPLNRDEVRASLARFKERRASADRSREEQKKGKLFCVMGAKGGVGTTTLAVNFAAGLVAANGKRPVSLVDANLLFGEVPLFLDIKSAFHWGEIAKDISRLDSAYLLSVLSKHSSGIHVLPAPARIDGMQGVSPEMVGSLFEHMRATFEATVVDCGHSLNDIVLKIFEFCDTLLLVGVLSVPCLINLKRLGEIFERLGYPEPDSVKVIMNRYQKKSMISLEEAEKSLERKVFWTIPNDYQGTMNSINQGKLLAAFAHRTAVGESLKELAAAFMKGKGKEEGKGNFLGTIFGRNSAK